MRAFPVLKLAMVQSELLWQDPEGNMKQLEAKLRALPRNIDLAVLPEMFTTGFTMNPEAHAEGTHGDANTWLAHLSSELGFAICGSVAAHENGKYFNRFLWAESGSATAVYDKRHLFRMAGEHEVYSPGQQRELIVFKGWKIMPRICYDLRFPVWSRSSEAHLQLYVANWPAARIDAWDKLLMARAIENLCYVVGVNRVGSDGNGVQYNGHSAAIDFKGMPLVPVIKDVGQSVIVELQMDALQAFREKFPAHLDADRFTLL